ncbi:hypothetical protein COB72_06310 [bacterium]|nr:MAG: hypothetical protein COB72_06310 [bacterium]
MSNKSSKKSPLKIVISIVIVIIAAFFGIDVLNPSSSSDSKVTTQTRQQTSSKSSDTKSAWSTGTGSIADTQQQLVKLAKDKRSGQMVEFQARVVKILKDDNEGARHQRFILAIDYTPSPTNSILIAHNIDLAPRVPIETGDTVTVYGQYEWNDRGGVVHWTHHDPGGRHADGWIELDDQRYD